MHVLAREQHTRHQRLEKCHVGTGLATRDGEAPSGFEVTGADKVFHSATAMIDGDDLI